MTQRASVSRIERAAARRRARARAHLERVRGGRRPRRSAPSRLGWAVLALLAGAWIGPPVLRAATWALPGETGRVDHIRLRGAVELDPAALARAAGIEAGVSPAEIDPDRIAARLSELPRVRSARALQLPLGPLLIGIEERVPVAVALAGESATLVDATATAFEVLDALEPSDLPRLRLPGNAPPALGETDPQVVDALELAYGLPERGLPLPEEVGIAAPDDPEGFSLRLPGLAPRVLLGRDELDARLAELARLVAAGLPELADAASLDLRFADHAVLRERASQGGTSSSATSGGRRASPE